MVVLFLRCRNLGEVNIKRRGGKLNVIDRWFYKLILKDINGIGVIYESCYFGNRRGDLRRKCI